MNCDRTYFSNICIDLTERCNIRCRHCILDVNEPGKPPGWAVIERLITEAADLQEIQEIAFVGGEPFLEYQTLVKSVALCRRKGLRSSVVTNGSWAKNADAAKKMLGELDGLTTLSVSTDRFHQEFVPVENIKNVIVSCHELGIECHVYISHLNHPESEVEAVKNQLAGLEKYYRVNQQPVLYMGRAAKELDRESIFTYDPGGKMCYCIDSPLIRCDGDVIACCGAAIVWPRDNPLRIGNIHNQTLGEIRRDARLNPVIHALRVGGPDLLVRLVREQADKEDVLFTPPPNQIRDLCSLCGYIFTNPEYSCLLQRAVSDPAVSHRIAVDCLIEFAEIDLLLEEG